MHSKFSGGDGELLLLLPFFIRTSNLDFRLSRISTFLLFWLLERGKVLSYIHSISAVNRKLHVVLNLHVLTFKDC